LNKFTAIARPLNFSYKSNRIITLAMMGVILAGSAYRWISGTPILPSVSWGFQAGLTVFLSWALGRELDPDYSNSALIAAVFSLLAIVFFPLPSLGIVFWLLILLRILNHTTGLSPTTFDLLSFIGIAFWISQDGNWEYLFLSTLALFLDYFVFEKERKKLVFAGLGLLLLAYGFVSKPLPLQPTENFLFPGLLALAASMLFLPIIIRSRKVDSTCDQTQAKIQPLRLQTCQSFGLAAGLIAAGWQSSTGLINFSPFWSAVLGSLLSALIRGLRPHFRKLSLD
jgi:hypothetical protein